jgi:hypothetical protein
MIKKSFIAIFTILLLVISILSAVQVEVAEANPIPWCFDPQMTVTIQSPENGTTKSLPVKVSFTSKGDHQFSVSDEPTKEWVRSFFYILDGQDKHIMGMRFEGTKTEIINEKPYKYEFTGQAYLTNLADGPHNITVYYGAVNKISYVGTPQEHITYSTAWQATSYFYVQSKLTPSPTTTQTPNLTVTTNPTSNNSILSFNSLSNNLLLTAVLSILGLITIILLVSIYKRRKLKTTG